MKASIFLISNNLIVYFEEYYLIWGNINIFKMIIAPRFSYSLPITIPYAIFKKYDDVVKQFLWEGKKPRIKISKHCERGEKEKGGLGLPDSRLYAMSFEMAKLDKYWKLTVNGY